jgi:IclR family acetate operon transcriptional repressor
MNLSVKRAVTILEYLAEAAEPRDLAAISSDLVMNKSTVHRFLSTLVETGYVRQEAATGRYALGARVAWLASKFLETLDIRKIARAGLEQLAEQCGETVHLAIADRNEVAYIDKIDGRQAVRMVSRIGSRAPMHSTALGRILLANMPENKWQRYVAEAGLTARTPNTITDPPLFYQHLRQVREQNYCIDDVEHEQGVRCVAAPIKDHTGKVIAALSISGWTITMTPERVETLRPLVQQTGLEISKRLGFNAPEEYPISGGVLQPA